MDWSRIHGGSHPIIAILVGCKGLKSRGYASPLVNRLREEYAEQGSSSLWSVSESVNGVAGHCDRPGPGMVRFFLKVRERDFCLGVLEALWSGDLCGRLVEVCKDIANASAIWEEVVVEVTWWRTSWLSRAHHRLRERWSPGSVASLSVHRPVLSRVCSDAFLLFPQGSPTRGSVASLCR